MQITSLAAAAFVLFHQPNNGGEIWINAHEVVFVRDADRATGSGHIQNDVECVIGTVDGKFFAVIEPCDKVRELLRNAK